MFDPQRIYDRQHRRSYRGQVIQKKPIKQFILNDYQEIINLLKVNGYSVVPTSSLRPITIDEFIFPLQISKSIVQHNNGSCNINFSDLLNGNSDFINFCQSLNRIVSSVYFEVNLLNFYNHVNFVHSDPDQYFTLSIVFTTNFFESEFHPLVNFVKSHTFFTSFGASGVPLQFNELVEEMVIGGADRIQYTERYIYPTENNSPKYLLGQYTVTNLNVWESIVSQGSVDPQYDFQVLQYVINVTNPESGVSILNHYSSGGYLTLRIQ